MKKMKTPKKLHLAKETLGELEHDELRLLAGGASSPLGCTTINIRCTV